MRRHIPALPRLNGPHRGRFTALAAAAAAMLAAGLAAAPAHAATGHTTTGHTTTGHAAGRESCGGSATVRLHGREFHVHMSGRFGIVPMRGHRVRLNQPLGRACHGTPTPAQVSGALTYGGGPVATSPVVYLDFWGSQWDSDPNGVEAYMQSLFSGLGDGSDTWSTTMTQYTDASGNPVTFTGPVLAGTWVDDSAPAPQSASQADLAAEAQNAAAHFGVSGPQADVFVLSPSGTNPDGFPNAGFCAWHDWNGTTAYTNMPYVLDAGGSCGADSVQNQLDGFSIVGGHEYGEAVTDPEPSSGWVDQSNGEEIGDLCAWTDLQAISLDTGSFAMQPLWSDNANGCVQ
jgi:serine protease